MTWLIILDTVVLGLLVWGALAHGLAHATLYKGLDQLEDDFDEIFDRSPRKGHDGTR